MLIEYVEEALRRARYEMIEDQEPYYGEVPELKGVWATGKTLEECRENLKNVIEGWILVSLKRDMPVKKNSESSRYTEGRMGSGLKRLLLNQAKNRIPTNQKTNQRPITVLPQSPITPFRR